MESLSLLVVGVAAALAGGCALEITDEEYARLPRLYHLDDYSACLSKAGGLYCLGSFHIQPPRSLDSTYELIKEYSADPYNFNRTEVHRGYCVSERCPSSERNTTRRFEQCGAQWGRKRKLRLTLKSLKYCKSYAQEFARKTSPAPFDLPQKAMLLAVAVLAGCNAVGTAYDLVTGDDAKKNQLVAAWSLRSNWRRLTATYSEGDPRLTALAPVQGVRVFLMLLIIGTHAGCIHDMLYLQNPRYIEQAARNPLLMLFMNGTSVVMIFVLVSSFLLAYNLLLLPAGRLHGPGGLAFCVLKRMVRISPVSLVVVGFAATFWPGTRGGPMWPLVEDESRVCRDKFWTHALYLNNLVRPDDHCLVQTWFLATDMQLYVLGTALTLWLAGRRSAVPILASLVAASCLLNGLLAYVFEWKSLMYIVYPSTLRTMYHGEESFYRLYTAPWGSLPACLVGLLLAHLHKHLQDRGIKPTDYTVFRWAYTVSPALMVAWIVSGTWVREVTDPATTAAHVALERPVLSVLAATVLLGMFNGMTGGVCNVFSWSGWHAPGRMSLSVLMVHWILNTWLAASRPLPIATSLLDVTADSVVTIVLSYLVAAPLTLAVEMPLVRVFNALLFARRPEAEK